MPMPKPPKLPMPGRSMGQMPSTIPHVTLNPEAFNGLIKAHGVRMIHSRPLPCPNVRDIRGGDHDPSCNSCYNGYLYYGAKEVIAAFMGNTFDRQFQMSGSWDMDQAVVVMPTACVDGTSLDVQVFDQLVMPDYTVRYYQRVEYSQTGVDRLHFPAVQVEKAIGSGGNEFVAGQDFIVNGSGRIEWISNNRPGYDPVLDTGVIYSVTYFARPTFTIIMLPNQLRVTQTMTPTGPNVQSRFPQQAVVRKDFIPYKSEDKVGSPDTPEPRNGSL